MRDAGCGMRDYGDATHPASRSPRSEEHTSELQSRLHLVCRLLLEKKKPNHLITRHLLLVTLAAVCTATLLATLWRSSAVPLRRWSSELRATAAYALPALFHILVLA